MTRHRRTPPRLSPAGPAASPAPAPPSGTRRTSAIEDLYRWKLSLLRSFVEQHGFEALTTGTAVAPGVRLGEWVANLRAARRRGGVPRWLRAELEAIPGFTWTNPKQVRHRRRLAELRAHARRHGLDGLASDPAATSLARWAKHRRRERRAGTLAPWLAAALERIPGWRWDPREERQRERLAALQAYVRAHGWSAFRVRERPTVFRGLPIGEWVANLRSDRARGHVPAWLREALEAIPGWSWGRSRTR